MKIAEIVADGHRESGALDGIKRSIETVGLLHPITVVRETFYRPGGAEDGYRLVAGRRRLLACQELGWEDIPVHILEFEGEAAKKLTDTAELDENLARKSLTVLEKGEWLHRQRVLYEQIHGKSEHGGDRQSAEVKGKKQDGESPTWSAELAKETGEDESAIVRRDRVARELDGNTKERAKEIGLDNDIGRLTKLVRLPEGERRKVMDGINSAEEFDAKVTKKKQNNSERQKAADELAAILAKHIPPDLFPKVDEFLKVEGASVLRTAFRKIYRAAA